MDRVKLVLAGDLARRWTPGRDRRGSAQLAGVSDPGLPAGGRPALYRYQLRLRLARALDLPRAVRRPDRPRASTSASPATVTSAPSFREALRAFAFGVQAVGAASLGSVQRKSLKISTATLYAVVYSMHRSSGVLMEGDAMVEKTCAACDWKLDANAIKVKIGGKTVEVCCEECAQS